MHRLKPKIQVVFACMLCTVLFFPMPVHAYSAAETKKVFQDNVTEYYNHFVNGGYLENRVAR